MIEELQKQLDTAIQSNQQKNVTNIRGKLISAYKKKIKELQSKKQLTEGEQINLNNLNEQMQKEISEHKIQLGARYSNEVVREETSLSKIIEVPKKIGIAVEKVKACIEDLKLAKTVKQKVFKLKELVGALGIVAATPVIYAGKVALKHWYIPFAALSVLKITDSELIKKFFDFTNLPKGVFGTFDEIRETPVIKQIYEGFDYVTDKAIDGFKNAILK